MCVKNKSNNLLDSNKSTNFNKKSYFKTFVYVLYDTYDFTIRYAYCIVQFMNTYDTPIRYGTFYIRYDTYRVSYDTDNYDRGDKRIQRDGTLVLFLIRQSTINIRYTISNLKNGLLHRFLVSKDHFCRLGFFFSLPKQK